MEENVFVIGFNFLREVTNINERVNFYSNHKNVTGYGVFEGFGCMECLSRHIKTSYGAEIKGGDDNAQYIY